MIQFDRDEVLELLPTAVRESTEFSRGKIKDVLAALYFYNGMDKVKTDGYFFIDNVQLAQAIGIAEKNLLACLRRLEDIGFISRKSGKRGVSSEYIVFEDVIKNYTQPTQKGELTDTPKGELKGEVANVSKTENTYGSIVSETPIVSKTIVSKTEKGYDTNVTKTNVSKTENTTNENKMSEERIIQEISGLRAEMQEVKELIKQIVEANTYASIVSEIQKGYASIVSEMQKGYGSIVSETPIVSTDTDSETEEKEISTIVDTKKKTTTQQTTSTQSDIIGDNNGNNDIQSIQSKQTDTEAIRRANDFFTKKKIRLVGEDNKGGMFKSLHDTKDKEGAEMYIDAIRKDIISLRRYSAYFSERQNECINRWESMVDKAEADKAEYFKRGEEMEQEYQAKLAAEKALKAGYSVNISQQPKTAAPVNDKDKMDSDNEFTNSLLGDSSEVKTYYYGRKSNRQVLDFEDLKRTAVEYAQADYSEDVMQAKCREYVYMHSAGYGKDGQDNLYQVMMNCINNARQQVSIQV